MTDKPTIEFVNDWSELEEAIQELKELYGAHFDCEPDYCDEAEVVPVARVLIDYVPRLLTQYASLLETSYALTEGWEAYVKANPPKKLYLPDHR